jgi:hypothetical protein
MPALSAWAQILQRRQHMMLYCASRYLETHCGPKQTEDGAPALATALCLHTALGRLPRGSTGYESRAEIVHVAMKSVLGDLFRFLKTLLTEVRLGHCRTWSPSAVQQLQTRLHTAACVHCALPY